MARRQGIDNGCAVIEHGDRPVALQPFVGFHAPVDLVAVLYLNITHGVALNPALLVHQLDIIEDTSARLDPEEFRRAGAVALPTDDNLLRHGRTEDPSPTQCEHSHDEH